MKKHVFSAALTIIMGLTAFGMADAQRRGPGGGFAGRGMFGLFGVELTDAQREQIRAIHQEERASRSAQPAGVPLHAQLRAELLADAPEHQKIDALREQIVAAQSERLTREIAIQQKIAAILTPEQRAQARETLAKTGERRRGGQPEAAPRGIPRQ